MQAHEKEPIENTSHAARGLRGAPAHYCEDNIIGMVTENAYRVASAGDRLGVLRIRGGLRDGAVVIEAEQQALVLYQIDQKILRQRSRHVANAPILPLDK